MARALAGLTSALCILLLAGAALAQALPRVAIGPVSGPRANAARYTLTEALREHDEQEIALVPASDYAAAAERLGVDGLAGEEDVALVGRELRLDAVLISTIERRGRRYLLRIRVLRGRDGSVLGTTSWDLQSIGELPSIQGEIWDQIARYFRVDGGAPGGAGAGGAGGAGGGGRPGGASGASDNTAGGRAPDVERPVPPAEGVAPTPGLGFLTVTVGGGLSQRFWRMPVLSAGPDSRGSGSVGDVAPRGYENPAFGELRAEAMVLYRWSRDRAGVGLSAAVGVPLGLSSRIDDPATMMRIPLPTSAFEIWGGLAAAYRPPGGGFMRGQLGFAMQSFNVDTRVLPAEQQLGPVSYTGLRAAFDAVLPIYATPQFEFGALFGGELRIAEVGADLKIRFGQNPRPTLGLGTLLGIAMRLDGITPGLGLRLSADLMRYRTAFNGPYEIGVGSDSVDDFFRFHLAVSYAIGTSAPAPAAPPAAAPRADDDGRGGRPRPRQAADGAGESTDEAP